MESKLPPFYVGQKVERIKTKTIHTVTMVYEAECGCWEVQIDCKHLDCARIGDDITCNVCKRQYFATRTYLNFHPIWLRPVESQPFHLITLSKIQTKEAEKEEVKEYDKQLIGEN